MSNSCNAVLVVVDQLSKLAYYITTTTEYNFETLARLFLDNIFYHYGLPDFIVTDYSVRGNVPSISKVDVEGHNRCTIGI